MRKSTLRLQTGCWLLALSTLPALAQASQPQPAPKANPQPSPAAAKPAPAQEKPVSIGEMIRKNQLPSRFEGQAKLILAQEGKPVGKIFTFTVTVDLTGTAFVVEEKERVPGVLGAYTLGVRFDPAKTRLVDVEGGAAEFAGKPVFTNAEKANKEGLVRFSAVHTSSKTPTGKILVARVKLEISDPAAANKVEVLGDSLATSILFYPERKIVGPMSIPFTGKKLERPSMLAPKK